MQTLSTISSNKSASFITYLDKHALDSQAYAHIENTAKKYLAITTGQIRYAKVFEIYIPLNEQEKQQVTQCLADNLQYEFKEQRFTNYI